MTPKTVSFSARKLEMLLRKDSVFWSPLPRIFPTVRAGQTALELVRTTGIGIRIRGNVEHGAHPHLGEHPIGALNQGPDGGVQDGELPRTVGSKLSRCGRPTGHQSTRHVQL